MILLFLNQSGQPTVIDIPDSQWIGFGLESTFGAGAFPTTLMPAISASFSDTKFIQRRSDLTNELGPWQFATAEATWSGSSTILLQPWGIGQLLQCALGADYTTTIGAPSTYVFTPKYMNGPSIGLTTYENLALPLLRSGAVVDSVTFHSAFNEIVSSDWTFAGGAVVKSIDPLIAPTLQSVDPFSFTGASIWRQGVQLATFEDISLTIANGFTQRGILRKSILPTGYIRSSFDVTVNATVVLDDSTEWDLFEAGTEFQMSIKFESGDQSLTFDIPRLVWATNSPSIQPMVFGRQNLTAFVPRQEKGPALTATLVTAYF